MGSVAASFPIFAASYGMLAVAFLLLKETIRDELIELVGEHAGEERLVQPGAVAVIAARRHPGPAAPRAGRR